MELKVKGEAIKTLYKNSKIHSEEMENRYGRWLDDDDTYSLDAEKMIPEELDDLEKLIDPEVNRFNKILSNRIKKFNQLRTTADLSATAKHVNQFPTILKQIMSDLENKWIYAQKEDGQLLPYFVESIEYHPKNRDNPAYSAMRMNAEENGETKTKSIIFYAQHLKIPIKQLFDMKGIFLETKKANNTYQSAIDRFHKLSKQIGKQMNATGVGKVVEKDNRWSWSYYTTLESMVKDRVPTKVVIDTESKDDYHKSKTSGKLAELDFWGGPKIARNTDNEDEDDYHAPRLPIHPYLEVFDLIKHRSVLINSEFLEEYEWDTTLFDKLVLKQEHKDLISILMESTGESIDDIVKGKMNGVIVLATGKLGIGKTLTAEVFSENIEKPLYTVQCSQLGLDVNSVEDNLKTILSNAEKWGAILLIDEADVYIRERGDDINQNAIVGVFLRVLEYYKGILFMTSNRGDIIDDAIMSRSTAWIQYDLPEPSELKQIWEVLGTQYGAKFTKKELDQLTSHFKGISGRTVRNLLKLAHLLSKSSKEKKITVDMIKTISSYQKLEC